MMTVKPICILEELPISDLSLVQAQKLLLNRAFGQKSVLLMADMGQLMRCARSTAVQDACLASDLILAEGEEVRVAAAMMGTPFLCTAFSAAELLFELMRSGTDRFFFIGGESGAARRAAVSAARRAGKMPCPAVGGAPGNFCRRGTENTAVLTRIWECQPNVVVIGMEDGITWIMDNYKKLPSALYICIPSQVIQGLAQENAPSARDRISPEAWQFYRTRLAFYLRVRRRMRKKAQ